MTTYKAIEMENYKDEPLQFVGVYVLHWRPEWGEPLVGFVKDDETESKLERMQRIEKAAQKYLESKDGVCIVTKERKELLDALAAALEAK